MIQLTEETFEKTLHTFIRSDRIDLRGTAFIDPYGMVGLLEIGELCMLEDVKKTVLLPRSTEVLRYLERMDFFPHARRYFTLDPMQPPVTGSAGESDVLLEITPIERSGDIHFIVGTVRDRAQDTLAGLDAGAAAYIPKDDYAEANLLQALRDMGILDRLPAAADMPALRSQGWS